MVAGFSGELTNAPIEVSDIAALRQYSGPASTVLVRDEDTNFLFTVDSSNPTANNVKVFLGDDSRTWVMQAPDDFYTPEMWSQPAGGTTPESARLAVVASAMPAGGQLHLKPNTTYTYRRRATLPAHVTVHGNGATLKRIDSVSSAISGAVTLGQTVFTVADASGFAVGDQVSILDNSTLPNYNVNDSVGLLVISDITSNTITVSIGASAAYAAATMVLNPIGFVLTSGASGGGQLIENAIFDGNASNNTVSYAWTIGTTISGNASRTPITIRGCHFFDIANENIVAGSLRVQDCTYEDLNGSFCHFTNNLDTDIATDTNANIISGVTGSNSGIQSTANGHAESLITWSSSVHNVTIENVTAYTGDHNCFGNLSDDDQRVTVKECLFKDFDNIVRCLTTTGNAYQNTMIVNNDFIDAGDFLLEGDREEVGDAMKKLKIIGNTVINGRLMMIDCAQFTIAHNQFHTDTAFSDGTTGQDAFFYFQDCSDFIVDGNIIEGAKTWDSNAERGIFINATVAMKDGATGTNQDFWKCQNVTISNNQIRNFPYGLATVLQSHRVSQQTKAFVNMLWIGNTINESRDSSAPNDSVGICVPPGCIATGNIIARDNTENAHSSSDHSVIVLGIHDATNTTTLPGGQFVGNYVSGVRFIAGGTSGNSTNNVIVRNNFGRSTVTDNSTGPYSDVSNNTASMTHDVGLQTQHNENTGVY